jgi:hypothetical protein
MLGVTKLLMTGASKENPVSLVPTSADTVIATEEAPY